MRMNEIEREKMSRSIQVHAIISIYWFKRRSTYVYIPQNTVWLLFDVVKSLTKCHPYNCADCMCSIHCHFACMAWGHKVEALVMCTSVGCKSKYMPFIALFYRAQCISLTVCIVCLSVGTKIPNNCSSLQLSW